jgi:U3 small nucleolar RNA-associated protein 20
MFVTSQASSSDSHFRTILPALESDPLPTLVLLNNLASKGYLAGSLSVVQGGRWRAALVKSLQALFEVVKADLKADANRPILAQLLHLLPSLRTEGPLFMDTLRTIISTLHDRNPDQATARSNWLSEGVWNDGHLLALALTSADELCLDVTVATSLNALLVQSGALATMTSTWSWNRGVLQALSVLVERWQDDLR